MKGLVAVGWFIGVALLCACVLLNIIRRAGR